MLQSLLFAFSDVDDMVNIQEAMYILSQKESLAFELDLLAKCLKHLHYDLSPSFTWSVRQM